MRRAACVAAAVVLGVLGAPSTVIAHGDEEAMSGDVAALAKQPARVLAQQAIGLLEIRNQREEAAARLDAALESKDQHGIDVATLRQAMETLDAGHESAAVPLLDRALSEPLGASSGKALHEAGREFQPATGAQEYVGIALGTALLALGAGLLLRRRLHP